MTWYAIRLTYDDVLSGRQQALIGSLDALLTKACFPSRATAFMRYNIEDNSAEIFISPAAVPICHHVIQQFQGVPCDSPRKGKYMSFLLGNDDDKDMLSE